MQLCVVYVKEVASIYIQLCKILLKVRRVDIINNCISGMRKSAMHDDSTRDTYVYLQLKLCVSQVYPFEYVETYEP